MTRRGRLRPGKGRRARAELLQGELGRGVAVFAECSLSGLCALGVDSAMIDVRKKPDVNHFPKILLIEASSRFRKTKSPPQ